MDTISKDFPEMTQEDLEVMSHKLMITRTQEDYDKAKSDHPELTIVLLGKAISFPDRLAQEKMEELNNGFPRGPFSRKIAGLTD